MKIDFFLMFGGDSLVSDEPTRPLFRVKSLLHQVARTIQNAPFLPTLAMTQSEK